MERHAYLAGGEAKVAFRDGARQEAGTVLARMKGILEERPGHSDLERRIAMLYETIANLGLSSTAIYRDVDDALAFLSTLG